MAVAEHIDVAARRAAADLIERYVTHQIASIQLDHGWPRTDDVAVTEVERLVWVLYDDIWPEAYRPHPDADDFLHRCIDFLRTDLPYTWPVPPAWFQLATLPLNLVTLGRASRWLGRQYDFPKHWPFASEEAREQARSTGGSGHAAPAS